jgi:hypothetical protein
LEAFPVMKIGVGLILTVGASKKSNSVFMKDIEDVKKNEMLARAFGGLMADDSYEGHAITFQPPRSMTPKSSQSSCCKSAGIKTPAGALKSPTRGALKSPTGGARKPPAGSTIGAAGGKKFKTTGLPPLLGDINNVSTIEDEDDVDELEDTRDIGQISTFNR